MNIKDSFENIKATDFEKEKMFLNIKAKSTTSKQKKFRFDWRSALQYAACFLVIAGIVTTVAVYNNGSGGNSPLAAGGIEETSPTAETTEIVTETTDTPTDTLNQEGISPDLQQLIDNGEQYIKVAVSSNDDSWFSDFVNLDGRNSDDIFRLFNPNYDPNNAETHITTIEGEELTYALSELAYFEIMAINDFIQQVSETYDIMPTVMFPTSYSIEYTAISKLFYAVLTPEQIKTMANDGFILQTWQSVLEEEPTNVHLRRREIFENLDISPENIEKIQSYTDKKFGIWDTLKNYTGSVYDPVNGLEDLEQFPLKATEIGGIDITNYNRTYEDTFEDITMPGYYFSEISGYPAEFSKSFNDIPLVREMCQDSKAIIDGKIVGISNEIIQIDGKNLPFTVIDFSVNRAFKVADEMDTYADVEGPIQIYFPSGYIPEDLINSDSTPIHGQNEPENDGKILYWAYPENSNGHTPTSLDIGKNWLYFLDVANINGKNVYLLPVGSNRSDIVSLYGNTQYPDFKDSYMTANWSGDQTELERYISAEEIEYYLN